MVGRLVVEGVLKVRHLMIGLIGEEYRRMVGVLAWLGLDGVWRLRDLLVGGEMFQLSAAKV